LIQHRNLTLWVDEEARQVWQYTGPRQRGAQYVYAEAAIQCVLTRRAVYHLALRAAQGLAPAEARPQNQPHNHPDRPPEVQRSRQTEDRRPAKDKEKPKDH
jgi:hypothetical protein